MTNKFVSYITLFYGSSGANNGKGAFNTPVFLMFLVLVLYTCAGWAIPKWVGWVVVSSQVYNRYNRYNEASVSQNIRSEKLRNGAAVVFKGSPHAPRLGYRGVGGRGNAKLAKP
eukprot:1195027-Prorocentrum_minimum.AAC.2